MTSTRIHASAIISPDAEVASDAEIGAFVIVGENCTIGRGCVIAPRATLERNVTLGGATGPVLDPIFSLRRRLQVAPGASVALAFTTAVADSRQQALALDRARTLLKAWSSGGVAAADLVMLDVAMELYNGADAQRGFASTAEAFNKDIEPPTLVFEGK